MWPPRIRRQESGALCKHRFLDQVMDHGVYGWPVLLESFEMVRAESSVLIVLRPLQSAAIQVPVHFHEGVRLETFPVSVIPEPTGRPQAH